MSQLSMDCVRDMMCLLEKHEKTKSNGKPDPFYLKKLIYPELTKYTEEERFTAAKYIAEKKLITCVFDPQTTSPKAYKFVSFTPTGRDYLNAIREDTVWNKVKETLGSSALGIVGKVIDCALTFLG